MTATRNIDFETLLGCFTFRARVFFAGQLCTRTHFDANAGHLHVLRAGTVHLVAGRDTVRSISAPAMIFFPRASEHQIVPQGDEGATLACTSIDLGLHPGHPLVSALPELLVMQLDQMPVLANVIEALFLEAGATPTANARVLDRLAEVSLILALRRALAEEPRQGTLLQALSDERLARALTAVHSNPGRPWTLVDLAECAGMSRARFAARFNELVGMPPGEYLGHWRIGVAKTMLARGEPLKTVADAAGYSNPSALARAFQQFAGHSPSAWLHRHQA